MLSTSPNPLPPTVSQYIIHTVDLYLFTQEKEEEVNSKKGRGALVYKRGLKYQHDWLYLQSLNYKTS